MADQSKFNFLLQAALTGYRSLEWLPIFVARFSMGLFFCVSGYNKLFIVEKHEDLIKLMAKIGLPLHHVANRSRDFIGHRVKRCGVEFAAFACQQLGFQACRTRQAANMGGENAIGADLHVILLSILQTCS